MEPGIAEIVVDGSRWKSELRAPIKIEKGKIDFCIYFPYVKKKYSEVKTGGIFFFSLLLKVIITKSCENLFQFVSCVYFYCEQGR